MRRLIPIGVMALLPTMVLAGCAAENNSAAPKDPEEKKVAGIYLGGEYVAFGEYDYEDPRIKWIDPCKEIPREVLAQAGFDMETLKADYSFNMNSCESSSGGHSLMIMSGRSDYGHLIATRNISPNQLHASIGAVTDGQSDRNKTCSVIVPTLRGSLMLVHIDMENRSDFSLVCPRAISAMNVIIDIMEEK